MTNFIKINAKDIKIGMRFSAPVFFDDGKNMFLAEGRAVKSYHIGALQTWAIPFVLTYGRELRENEIPNATKPPVYGATAQDTPDDVEDLEELEELDEL